MKRINITLTPDLLASMRTEAKRQGVPLSELIRMAIREFLKEQKS